MGQSSALSWCHYTVQTVVTGISTCDIYTTNPFRNLNRTHFLFLLYERTFTHFSGLIWKVPSSKEQSLTLSPTPSINLERESLLLYEFQVSSTAVALETFIIFVIICSFLIFLLDCKLQEGKDTAAHLLLRTRVTMIIIVGSWRKWTMAIIV